MNDLRAGTAKWGVAKGTAILAALMLSATSPAGAQSPDYHVPPKLIKAGTNTSPVAGPGVVVVQVFVKPDGSFQVTKIIRTTNHGDDAAALEIARTSTYSPASKGGKKDAEFYDFTLKFTASSFSTGAGEALDAYQADVNAGKYAAAKTGLTSYLASHPEDPKANALLGISDFFLDDYAGAVAAFNKVDNIPSPYKNVAANAYAKAAQAALAGKDPATAVADAMTANRLAPGPATLNLLGTAQIEAGDSAAAVRSLEQAHVQAASDAKMEPKQRATVTANLIAAYLGAGEIDKAVALLPEVQQLDPTNTAALARVIDYYSGKAEAAQRSGDIASAVALWDKAGALGGQFAPLMYTNEAVAYMQGSKPDWKAAKAAADKALALKPDDAQANLAAGVALANDGKRTEAIPYLQKADASAKASGDTSVSSKAEQFLKQLGAPAK